MKEPGNRRPDLETLIADYQPMVARICASYERDRDLARELAQEVWFAVWRALPSFRSDSTLKTFVARIAQFRAISHVTQRARKPPDTIHGEELPPVPVPEIQVIAADERDRVLQAVRRLPIAYREPVILTLEDFSPAVSGPELQRQVLYPAPNHQRPWLDRGRRSGHEPEIPYVHCHANVPIYWPAPKQDPQVLHSTKEKWGPNKATDVNDTGWIAGFEVATTDYGFVDKPNGTGGLIYVPPVNPDYRDQRVYGSGRL